MNALPLILTVFVACAVEAIEALTIVLAAGITREWKSTFQGMAVALMERHGGRVPADKDALALLPGVGPKTANVVVANAFGVPALAVD